MLQYAVRLGVDLGDALQCVVSNQAHKSPWHTVARAVDGGKHAHAAHGVKPIKIPGHPVAGLVKDRGRIEDLCPVIFRRQDRLLDAFRVIDAIPQIAVKRFDHGFLFFDFSRALIDFGFHLAFIVGEVIAHFEDGLSQRIVLTQGGVFRFELALTHLQTEFPGPAQAVCQAVHRNGHLADLVPRGFDFFLEWSSSTHVNQGSLEFPDGPDDGACHPPSDDQTEDQNPQRYISGIELQLGA